jgi:hypothetical protein
MVSAYDRFLSEKPVARQPSRVITLPRQMLQKILILVTGLIISSTYLAGDLKIYSSGVVLLEKHNTMLPGQSIV